MKKTLFLLNFINKIKAYGIGINYTLQDDIYISVTNYFNKDIIFECGKICDITTLQYANKLLEKLIINFECNLLNYTQNPKHLNIYFLSKSFYKNNIKFGASIPLNNKFKEIKIFFGLKLQNVNIELYNKRLLTPSLKKENNSRIESKPIFNEKINTKQTKETAKIILKNMNSVGLIILAYKQDPLFYIENLNYSNNDFHCCYFLQDSNEFNINFIQIRLILLKIILKKINNEEFNYETELLNHLNKIINREHYLNKDFINSNKIFKNNANNKINIFTNYTNNANINDFLVDEYIEIENYIYQILNNSHSAQYIHDMVIKLENIKLNRKPLNKKSIEKIFNKPFPEYSASQEEIEITSLHEIGHLIMWIHNKNNNFFATYISIGKDGTGQVKGRHYHKEYKDYIITISIALAGISAEKYLNNKFERIMIGASNDTKKIYKILNENIKQLKDDKISIEYFKSQKQNLFEKGIGNIEIPCISEINIKNSIFKNEKYFKNLNNYELTLLETLKQITDNFIQNYFDNNQAKVLKIKNLLIEKSTLNSEEIKKLFFDII